jgi:dihydroorotase
LTLKNGRWLDAHGVWREGPLVVRDGRVRLGVLPDPGDGVVDAAGGLIFPGGVDAHTHLREPGQEYKEGIVNGTRAALVGGVTTVLDMPNNVPPITSADRLAAKASLFRACSRVNWGLHVQAPVDATDSLGPHASAKVYMAKSSSLQALRDVGVLRDVFSSHRRVSIHAEDEARFVSPGQLGPRSHLEARPVEAVVSALRLVQEALAATPEARRPRLVLCHVSTGYEVEWLARAKAEHLDVWGETCPHYLLLDQDDYRRQGPRLKVNPPLRSEADVAAVRRGLADGSIDFVSSDHAPHTVAEKADEVGAPSGIAGIEWFLPAILSLVDGGVISLRRAVEVSSAASARCYGLQGRGVIEEGAWADLAVLRRRARTHPICTRAAYGPFAQGTLAWCVEATVVSGRLAYRADSFVEGPPGQEAYA